MDFMLIQSRLGFPGFNEIEPIFSRRTKETGDREQRYLLEHPEAAQPFSRRLDDNSEAARVWRDWLGLP
ncbi:hypothetical protein D3C81_2291940 [compost metagenome]